MVHFEGSTARVLTLPDGTEMWCTKGVQRKIDKLQKKLDKLEPGTRAVRRVMVQFRMIMQKMLRRQEQTRACVSVVNKLDGYTKKNLQCSRPSVSTKLGSSV